MRSFFSAVLQASTQARERGRMNRWLSTREPRVQIPGPRLDSATYWAALGKRLSLPGSWLVNKVGKAAMGQHTQRTENTAWHITAPSRVSVCSLGFGQGVQPEVWAGLSEQSRGLVAPRDWQRWEGVPGLVWKGKGSSGDTRIQ